MSKSVLVVDTPCSCTDCDLCIQNNADGDMRCLILGSGAPVNSIHENCPLIQLPQKRPCNYLTFEGYTNGYDKGWNDYRDTICKEGMVKHG